MSDAERLVAFEGYVTLDKWQDTSASGCKVTFQLADRDALAPFEKATRRRGKKAGQRYRAIFVDDAGEVLPAPADFWFLGASWSHSGGAAVAFAVMGEDLDYFCGCPTNDGDAGQGRRWHLTLVEIDDEEKPVDQVQTDKLEKLKGGPHSKAVARRCQEPEFQQFVASCTGTSPSLVGAETCDRWIKRTCGVQSKVEFDHDEAAWERYREKVDRPYLRWGERESRGSWHGR